MLKKERPGPLQGIRGRLTLTFCLLFALILAAVQTAGTYGIPGTEYEGRIGYRRAEALRSLDLVADAKKDRLLYWLNERRSAVNFVAANELVESRTMELLEGSGLAVVSPAGSEPWRNLRERPAYASLHRFFEKIRAAYGYYDSIQIADAGSGRVLVSTDPAHLGLDLSSSSSFSGTLAAGRGHLSDLEYLHGEESPSFFFGDVVRSRGGEVLAVLLMEVDAEKAIRPVLNAGEGLGEAGEAFIVNGEAQAIAALRHPLADGSRIRPLGRRVESEPARRAALGGQGHVEADDYRGEPVLAAYRYLPVTPEWGWGMVVKVDRELLFAPFRQDLDEAFLLALGGIAFVVLFTAALSGKITGPVLLLAKTAGGFAAGDLSARSGFRRADEIGSLAGVFDFMAERVQKSMLELEAQAGELRLTAGALEERQKVQEQALRVSSVLAASTDLEEFLQKGLDALIRATESRGGAVYLAEVDRSGTLRLAVALGSSPPASFPEVVSAGEGSLGLAARSLEAIAGESSRGSLVQAPLILQERLVGVLALEGHYPEGSGVLEVVEMTRSQLATAIDNALTHGETLKLASDLRSKNEELQAQAAELQAHAAELVAQRRRVEEADRLKSEFLSNMSHELRTPLNSVMALSQLMIARGPGKNPEQEAQYLAVIERNGRHLLNLINDILDISRIEAGRLEICSADFVPANLVENAVETVLPLLEAKGLKMVLKAEALPPMRSDEDRVRQILLNLLSNAVKFTESGGIEVRVFREKESICFAVQDTGIGIAEANMGHIFEEFRQVDGSTTRRHEGTGLGLAICRKLARLLGGEVGAESRPGRGSVFTLRLPPEPPAPVEASADAGVVEPSTDSDLFAS